MSARRHPVVAAAQRTLAPAGKRVAAQVDSLSAARVSIASPRASSCSSAKSRIKPSIENRVTADVRSTSRSDFLTSASSSSRILNSSCAPGNHCDGGYVEATGEYGASCEHGFLGTVEQAVRPLQGLVQCVMALDRSGQPASSRSGSSSRSLSSETVIEISRAAAISIASGMPSTRRQISATSTFWSTVPNAMSGTMHGPDRRTA